METYAPELTSPPVPLVALVGAPELLPGVADYLRTQVDRRGMPFRGVHTCMVVHICRLMVHSC